MTKTKYWFIATLIILIAGLFLVAGLVVYVDPFFHYHAPIGYSQALEECQSQGLNMQPKLTKFPYQIDNQTSQNPGIARNFTYDTVLIGSSMTVNFEANWFDELYGENMVKLCYNGAHPKDVKNTMEQVDRSKNQVKKVYLGVDLKSYTGDPEETMYPIPEYLHNTFLLDDVNYWFNKDVILDYIVKPIFEGEPATDLSSVYNSEWWMKEFYSKEYVLSHMDRVEKNDATFPEDMFLDGMEENLEMDIIPVIEEHPETEFVVFIPPYSIYYWYEYCQNNQFDACVKQYETFCQKMLEYDNVKLYFFAGDEELVKNLDNYGDVGHYCQAYNRYMAECFGRDEHRLSFENYMDVLESWADMVRTYEFE